MKITSLARGLALKEKGKKQVSIAQIMELLKLINKITKGVFYALIKALPVVCLMAWPVRAIDLGDHVKLTLIDHVQAVVQVTDGESRAALMDSVVLIGSHNGRSVLDLQAGVSGATKTDPNPQWLAGGFLKISTLVRDKIRFADHWKFLNSLEYGISYSWDLTDKRDYVSLQIGLAFAVDPIK